MFVSLLSGTTNAFAPIAKSIENTTDIDNSVITIFQSLGMVGLYFTVIAGWGNDSFGPLPTALTSGVVASGGYALVSFAASDATSAPAAALTLSSYSSPDSDSRLFVEASGGGSGGGSGDGSGGGSFYAKSHAWMIGLGITLTGFGSGGVFITLLATAIKSRPSKTGTGVALVGSCMSLSMAFTSLLLIVYNAASGCKGDMCWVSHTRFLACVLFAVMIPGVFCVKLLPKDGSLLLGDESESILPEGGITGKAGLLLDEGASSGGSGGSAYRAPSPGPGGGGLDGDAGANVVDLSQSMSAHEVTFAVDPDIEGSETLINTVDASQTVQTLMGSMRVFLHPYFWAMFISFFAAIGGGVLLIANFKLWEKYAPDRDFGTTLTIAFSVFNCTGTLIAGSASDWLERTRGITRSAVLSGFMLYGGVNMIGISFLIMSPHLVGSRALQNLLLVLHINGGLTFGSSFSLFPSLCSDIYGFVNFGKYFSFLQIGSTSSLLIPIIANRIQEKLSNFWATYLVMGILMLICAGLALLRGKSYVPS